MQKFKTKSLTLNSLGLYFMLCYVSNIEYCKLIASFVYILIDFELLLTPVGFIIRFSPTWMFY